VPAEEFIDVEERAARVAHGEINPATTKKAYLEFQRGLFRTERFACPEE
jgi:hypothetical protein